MSMSTRIVGFKPPDDVWRKMKAVYDACISARITVPDEVEDYFEGEEPDENGVEVDLTKIATEWDAGPKRSSSGYQIHLNQIDKDIKIIRFYNSW